MRYMVISSDGSVRFAEYLNDLWSSDPEVTDLYTVLSILQCSEHETITEDLGCVVMDLFVFEDLVRASSLTESPARIVQSRISRDVSSYRWLQRQHTGLTAALVMKELRSRQPDLMINVIGYPHHVQHIETELVRIGVTTRPAQIRTDN